MYNELYTHFQSVKNILKTIISPSLLDRIFSDLFQAFSFAVFFFSFIIQYIELVFVYLDYIK